MQYASFIERLQAVVHNFPDSLAIQSGAESLTYQELYARAAQAAAYLQELGAGPECVVGLGLEKSPEYIVALLGAWIAGAAFLPLDSSHPRDRLSFLVADSGASLILVQENKDQAFLDLPAPLVYVEDAGAATPLREPFLTQEEDLAYIIYTSGSTGRPKGVMVPHRGIVNLLEAQVSAFRIGPGSRSLLYLSTSFDASISDFGTALLSGATLCIEPASRLQTAAGLLQVIQELEITHVDLPPALLRILDPARAPECLQTIVIGGEICPPEVVRRWAARCRVVNVYGPTEATVCSSLGVCDPATWNRPLIGQPIPHVSFHILDSVGCAAPIETPGELYIGGMGLARGYRNRPEMDAGRFLEREGKRLYRTGDWVVRHGNGDVEFLGRVDRQVKVRGMLVAPEEIETQLLGHPGIRSAAVVKRSLGAAREALVAFVVPAGEDAPTGPELDRHLAAILPPWMLPQRYEFLEQAPLTPTGKIDLAELAARPLSIQAAVTFMPPSTPHERLLAGIWQRILGIDTIGLTGNFFELGGDSLAVVEMVAAAEAQGLPVSPALVMANPTISGILARLEDSDTRDARSCQWLKEDVALGPEWQERLWKARTRPLPNPVRESPRRIFLTGATGFLGSRLLHQLLCLTRAEVVCLVRAVDPAARKNRCLEAMAKHGLAPSPEQQARITALCGDIAKPQFGLEEPEWRWLAAEMDTIYHCAAQVNMVLPYEALRPGNVEGTREALRLMCEGPRKRLHYASTLSVFVASDRNRGRMEESDEGEKTGWIYGGYAQSKWAAEHLLRGARGDAGPTGIYRFGLITGDSSTGYSSSTDFLSLFFHGVAASGCIPEKAGRRLQVDITPVDFAAAAMARLSLHAAGEELSTFHIANSRGAFLQELVEAMRAEGVPIEEVAEEEWRQRLAERLAGGCSEAESAAYLALCRCLSGEEAFERQRTMDLFQATGTEFGMKNTTAGLRGTGLACPFPDLDLLRKYVRHALHTG